MDTSIAKGLDDVDAPLGPLITLQEAAERPAGDIFRVLARAVDFFPPNLEDACALRCARCHPR